MAALSTASWRWIAAACMVALAVGAVRLTSSPAEATVAEASATAGSSPRAPRARPSSPPASAAALHVQLLDRARPGPGDDDSASMANGERLFGAHSWQPPPPRQPAPPPPRPEPPRAPPFPYQYFGGMDDERGRLGFFLEGARVFAARAGDRLGDFQLDALDGAQATLTYAPLGQKVTVAINGPRQP